MQDLQVKLNVAPPRYDPQSGRRDAFKEKAAGALEFPSPQHKQSHCCTRRTKLLDGPL